MSLTKAEIKKKRKQRRRKLFLKRLFVTLLFLLVLAIAVFVVLALTVLFPVKSVEASGGKIYTSEQVIKASGLNSEDNIFTFSKKKVDENIHRILPYVDTVNTERILPDSVKITVTDAKEYESYLVNGKCYAVSRRGYVLNCYDEKPDGTFLIACDGVECKIGYKIKFKNTKSQDLVNELKKLLTKHEISINSIDVTDIYNIKAEVEDRFEVLFGHDSDLDRKVAHLEGMIENIGEGREGTVNLSMWTSKNSEGTFTEKKPLEE